MEVVVTTGAINRAKLQTNHHHQQTNIQFLTGLMSFLSPTNSVKAQKGKTSHFTDLLTSSSLCLWPLKTNNCRSLVIILRSGWKVIDAHSSTGVTVDAKGVPADWCQDCGSNPQILYQNRLYQDSNWQTQLYAENGDQTVSIRHHLKAWETV